MNEASCMPNKYLKFQLNITVSDFSTIFCVRVLENISAQQYIAKMTFFSTCAPSDQCYSKKYNNLMTKIAMWHSPCMTDVRILLEHLLWKSWDPVRGPKKWILICTPRTFFHLGLTIFNLKLIFYAEKFCLVVSINLYYQKYFAPRTVKVLWHK